ncbi:hypothetical protein B0H14DRAFT_3775829 [Mycena olivaceomarginata]|nr:hypothetical protein B0H14DRAFT_3775829 [Mycena olivaceomarginata]
MPRLSPRQAHTREVLKTFLDYHTTRMKLAIRRRFNLKCTFARMGLTARGFEELTAPAGPAEPDTLSIAMLSISEADTDSSISSDLSTTDSGPGHGDSWSDLLGSDWRRYSSSSSSASSTDTTDTTDTTLDSSSDNGMPELYPAGYPDSDDKSDSDSSSSTTGAEGDDEEDFEDDLDTELEVFSPRVGQNNPTKWVWHALEDLYAQQYDASCTSFPCGPAFLPHVLGVMKNTCPDLFRQELRMSPYTFDQLVIKLAGDPVLANDSQNA